MDDAPIREKKSALRKAALQKRLSGAGFDEKRFSENLLKALSGREGIVGAYCAFRGEIDAAAPLRGKFELAFPRVVKGKKREMEFVMARPGTKFSKGAYGILEPEGGETVVPDILIVPALSVDEEGFRLGYGGGFYDAYFERHPGCLKVGVLDEALFVRELPRGEHDAALDILVTDRSVRRFGR